MNLKEISVVNTDQWNTFVLGASNVNNVTFMPGSTEKIVWSFTDDITMISLRHWIFIPSDGRPQVALAIIARDGDVHILTTLYDFAVEKPATLVLKNVNLTYDGTYQFSLLTASASPSEVFVYIAGKFLLYLC